MSLGLWCAWGVRAPLHSISWGTQAILASSSSWRLGLGFRPRQRPPPGSVKRTAVFLAQRKCYRGCLWQATPCWSDPSQVSKRSRTYWWVLRRYASGDSRRSYSQWDLHPPSYPSLHSYTKNHESSWVRRLWCITYKLLFILSRKGVWCRMFC